MAHVMRSASRGWPGSRSAGSGSSTRRFASSSSTRSGNWASFLAMSGRPNCLATPSRNSATVLAGSKCSATNASVSSGVRQLKIFSTVTCMVRREASPSFASGSLIFASASFVSPGTMPHQLLVERAGHLAAAHVVQRVLQHEVGGRVAVQARVHRGHHHVVAHGHAALFGNLVVLGHRLEQLLYLGVHEARGHLGLRQVEFDRIVRGERVLLHVLFSF